MHKVTTTLLSAILACAALWASAGDDERFFSRLDARFAELDSLIAAAGVPEAISVLPAPEGDEDYARAVGEAVDRRIDAFRAGNGLEFAGQAYYRYGTSALADADEDEISRGYWGKIQVEARWNFLHSFLYKKEGRENVYRLEGRIDVLERQMQMQKEAVREQRDAFVAERDRLLAAALGQLSANYGLMQEAYTSLRESDNVLSEKIMAVMREKDDAERRMASLIPSDRPFGGLPRIEADAVEVDTAALFRCLAECRTDVQVLQARDELLGQKARNISWAGQASVTPFVRYSLYFRHVYPSSSVINAGVAFTLPANASAKREKAAIEAERSRIEVEMAQLRGKALREAARKAEAIERANRSIAAEAAHLAGIRSYLEERAAAYSAYSGRYDLISRMDGYNMYLQSLERLIRMRCERDCTVVDLQELAGEVPVLDFISVRPAVTGSIY